MARAHAQRHALSFVPASPYRWRTNARPAALLGILLIALSACGETGGERFLERYVERLERPLGKSISTPAARTIPRPPRAEALQITLAGADLDGLDFLRLRGCALQNTVARRNSSLGRMAPPSQRLLLELAFLRQAPACIRYQRDKGNGDLAALLAKAMQQKERQLSALIFNATLASPEYRDFWRPPGRLGTYPEQTGSRVITALEQIEGDARRWLSGDYDADGTAFELALSDIATGDGGELLTALEAQASVLGAANGAIDQRLAGGDLCAGGRTPSAAPILRTVVQKFFIGEVQPWSASLNQRYHALVQPLRALEHTLDAALPAAYVAWRDTRDRALDQSRAAPTTHVRRLQALLGPCYAEFARED